jgi:hypothetical protein
VRVEAVLGGLQRQCGGLGALEVAGGAVTVPSRFQLESPMARLTVLLGRTAPSGVSMGGYFRGSFRRVKERIVDCAHDR